MTRNLSLKLALLAAVSFVPAFAQLPKIAPFSGDFSTSSQHGQTTTGKIYFSLPKMRMEVSTNSSAGRVIILVDQNTQIADVLMTQQHMYIESKGTQANPMMRGFKPPTFDPAHTCGTAANCNKVGTETVNGRTCDKWVGTDGDATTTVWVDQTLHFPIKGQKANGDIWQLTNIKEGEPDASLFQIPSDYHKMDIPAMMGARQ